MVSAKFPSSTQDRARESDKAAIAAFDWDYGVGMRRRPLRRPQLSSGRLFCNESLLTTSIALEICFGHSPRAEPPLKCFTNAAAIEMAGSLNRRHSVRLRLYNEAGHAILNHLGH
jgi:hypothetical protein